MNTQESLDLLASEEQPKRRLGEVVAEAIQAQSEDRELEILCAVGEDAPMAQRIAAKIRLKQLGYE